MALFHAKSTAGRNDAPMSDGEFQEKPRHWWIKTVLPAVTAFVVALIGAVSLLYVSRDKGPVATDSQISITEVASSDSLVRTDVKYRVAANDQPVGPVRLLLDLPTTGGPENPRITGIKVSLNAGAKELADSILSVDMVGDLSGIRVKSAKWSPGMQLT
ncbi:hypothetical protein GS532_18815 [Rhodococcus hoagii]|nr:hypothetical protein [Prescottella equi]